MPHLIQLPGPQDVRNEQDRVKAPVLKDYAWEHEQQLVRQRALLETLRYKHYVRSATLSDTMQRMRVWSLHNAWWILLLAYEGYALTAHL